MIDIDNKNSKKIAKNTLLLYLRMLFSMAVSLYTSRIILSMLGVTDFGIYNVVGGVVAMFSVLSGSLSASISRFLTFELGRENFDKLKIVFSSAVTIQAILAFIVFILAETLAVWFLNNKMNIPSERIVAANWVFQCSILTFMINLLSIPYNASIVSHEHMAAYAYISIFEVLLKLLIVFMLVIFSFDKLILYAVLLLLVSLVVRFVYGFYCTNKFPECRYSFMFKKSVFLEIFSFAGWNFIGSSSSVLRDQGVNIILNIFCGPVVNAARGIAFQANSAIGSFTSNFMIALNPQITKSYASGNKTYMFFLIHQGSRLSFYMLLFLALPVIIEANYVLALWLKIVPNHTISFVRLVLLFTMSESISNTLVTAMLATGKIRNYQILVGGLQMLNFPVSYFLMKLGFIPESTMIAAIIISQCCLLARLWMLRSLINLSAKEYLYKVYVNVILVFAISLVLPLLISVYLSPGFLRFMLVCIVSIISTLLTIYFVGCSSSEKLMVRSKLIAFLRRLH